MMTNEERKSAEMALDSLSKITGKGHNTLWAVYVKMEGAKE